MEAFEHKMTNWARKVNERLDKLEKKVEVLWQAHQNRGLETAMTGKGTADPDRPERNEGETQFPSAFEGLELPPVPEDYAGKFSTWSPDKKTNQMRIIANLDALANPCYTEEYGGETYNIIPTINRSNRAGWIAVKADARTNTMEGKFEGVNYGEALSYIAFDDLLAVRGSQTEIDIEQWQVRTAERDSETTAQYMDMPASEDPF